jgi:hypothetical protein
VVPQNADQPRLVRQRNHDGTVQSAGPHDGGIDVNSLAILTPLRGVFASNPDPL